MTQIMKYRFKTSTEFRKDGEWNSKRNVPTNWEERGNMNQYLGEPVPAKFNQNIHNNDYFSINGWTFRPSNTVLNEPELKEMYPLYGRF